MDAVNSIPTAELKPAYPPIEPYNSGFLRVSELHELYYEECGQPDGKPVLFLHGGPGNGTSADDRCYFDPDVYRIVLLHQRGAGKSKPPAELTDNTTWHLVEDIEKLRAHLNVDKWVVFGGSWGSCLSLAYAQTHPERVKALVLRGIFTLRRKELEWYYQKGASHLFPDIWEGYEQAIPVVERADMMSAYYRRLTGNDKSVKMECARKWSHWEMATTRLLFDPVLLDKSQDDLWALQFASIECHYFVHGGFFKKDDEILDNVDKIRHIPCTIIQGRYDVVCPMDTAWQLHKRWPEAEFHIVADAGHCSREAGITSLLIDATNKYKHL